MNIDNINEIGVFVKIPDTAQIAIAISRTKSFYRFYAMPTFEEGSTPFTPKLFEEIVAVILNSQDEKSTPLPDDLKVQFTIFENEKRTDIDSTNVTYEKLCKITNLLCAHYPDYSLLRPFL